MRELVCDYLAGGNEYRSTAEWLDSYFLGVCLRIATRSLTAPPVAAPALEPGTRSRCMSAAGGSRGIGGVVLPTGAPEGTLVLPRSCFTHHCADTRAPRVRERTPTDR